MQLTYELTLGSLASTISARRLLRSPLDFCTFLLIGISSLSWGKWGDSALYQLAGLSSSRFGRRAREEVRMHDYFPSGQSKLHDQDQSQCKRPLWKVMSDKRGENMGPLIGVTNHTWHREQQLWSQQNRSTLLLKCFPNSLQNLTKKPRSQGGWSAESQC